LLISEGQKVVALPVVVGNFFIKNNGREVQAGENEIVFPTLDGPGDLPDSAWQLSESPDANLRRARQLIPGFELSRGNRETREKDEANEREQSKDKQERELGQKNDGEILLVIKNVMADQISLRASTNGMLVFRLSEEGFSHGEFRYDLLVEAKKTGKIEVKGYVIPFLAPVAGQEFSVDAAR